MHTTFVIGNFNQLTSELVVLTALSIRAGNEFAEVAEGLHQASWIYLAWHFHYFCSSCVVRGLMLCSSTRVKG
jgi:hypothetical protein